MTILGDGLISAQKIRKDVSYVSHASLVLPKRPIIGFTSLPYHFVQFFDGGGRVMTYVLPRTPTLRL